MKRVRLLAATGALALTAAAGTATVAAATPGTAFSNATFSQTGAATAYNVLATNVAETQSVADQLAKAGAHVTNVNRAIGLINVTSSDPTFVAKADKLAGVDGAAAERAIGKAPSEKVDAAEVEHALATTKKSVPKAQPKPGAKAVTGDPLDGLLWGMTMMRVPAAHAITLGDKRVRVGILDTGVDARHPDIAANFDKTLSRNFTTDMPDIDGPCEYPSCKDPADIDDQGHGTHVAGTIGAAMNGFGISGVIPEVDIVSIRGGQDSGFFFLGPVANALTYAGDIGLDAVNMSFYVDPWMYSCLGGAPEDTPKQAQEQNVIIKTMRRALNYANSKNVTLVAAMGNDHDNVSAPRMDVSSPNFPVNTAHPRTIDNASCFKLPLEGPNVIGVSAVGPSGTKSDYSNYATDVNSQEIEVSAPGGWLRDGHGTDTYSTNENLILSAAPLKPLQDGGLVDADGNVTWVGNELGVKKECTAATVPGQDQCGYYRYLQGTSMASPHATGVAALAVAAHGRPSPDGLTMSALGVRRMVVRTAINHPCPAGGVQDYTYVGRAPEWNATCTGTANFNGLYGSGITNALAVVR